MFAKMRLKPNVTIPYRLVIWEPSRGTADIGQTGMVRRIRALELWENFDAD